jgi:hypothetical protein
LTWVIFRAIALRICDSGTSVSPADADGTDAGAGLGAGEAADAAAGCAGCAAGSGAGAAAGAAAGDGAPSAAADEPLSMKASTSSRVTRPPAPVPESWATSMSCSRTSRRTAGVMRPAPSPPSPDGAASAACGLTDACAGSGSGSGCGCGSRVGSG